MPYIIMPNPRAAGGVPCVGMAMRLAVSRGRPVNAPRRGRGGGYFILAKLRRAASMVFWMSSWLWARDMKPASKADGAR
ncbi:hypothetical protein ETAR_06230 [Edwardsiella tarda]